MFINLWIAIHRYTMEPITDRRQIRGLEIAKDIDSKTPDVSIQRLNKLTYKVRSQSEKSKWYTIIRQSIRDKWTCDCPDFTFRLAKPML